MTIAHTHRNHITSEAHGSDQARGPTITASWTTAGRRRLMKKASAQMMRTLAALGPLGPCSSSYSTFAPSSSDL